MVKWARLRRGQGAPGSLLPFVFWFSDPTKPRWCGPVWWHPAGVVPRSGDVTLGCDQARRNLAARLWWLTSVPSKRGSKREACLEAAPVVSTRGSRQQPPSPPLVCDCCCCADLYWLRSMFHVSIVRPGTSSRDSEPLRAAPAAPAAVGGGCGGLPDS